MMRVLIVRNQAGGSMGELKNSIVKSRSAQAIVRGFSMERCGDVGKQPVKTTLSGQANCDDLS